MADVNAIVADGMATLDGMVLIMADVVAFVADGIATRSTDYFICLFFVKFWDVEQNLIPYVRQMVFAYISV